MESDQEGDKTELPTEHRRQEARKQGRVPRSHDLTTSAHLVALAFGLWVLGMPLVQWMASHMQERLSRSPQLQLDAGFVTAEYRTTLEAAATNVLPLMALAAGAAVLVGITQVGFLWVPDLLTPKWSHLNPIQGVKRIFSLQSLVKLALSVAKLAGVAAVAGWFIAGEMPRFLPATDAEPGSLLVQLEQSLVSLAMLLALALLALGLADFGWSRYKHEQELKMTRRELLDELKETDGDPHVRHRRKEAYQKLVKAREVHRVKEADVVITNPTHLAVAIKYDPQTMSAPTVLAKGKGPLALRIREIAAEHGIPIIERKPLAQALYKSVKIGHPVPVEMYEVFVEIMKYVYEITGKTPDGLVAP